uniref:Uncharacterized protein n=1 Tax=Rhizophora mucronata TaxID=61149 RepID=A0A2P2NXS7_RHIMU
MGNLENQVSIHTSIKVEYCKIQFVQPGTNSDLY